MKRTTISLPDDLAARLEREAARRGASVSGLVREFLDKGLNPTGAQPRTIPWAALFHDPQMPAAASLDEALGSWADDVDRDR
jgi:plasmid stability protein